MLKDLLLIPEEKFVVVEDWQTLSLGDKTLEFILTPWVHWPETMVTYVPEDNLLFSCDFFGSHLATSDLIATDEAKVYRSAKRYYAEIMMPFRTSIKQNIAKLSNLGIKTIAPSHGQIYLKPEFILKAYQDWISETVKNEVVIAYVSMHGSTQVAIDHFIDALMSRGVTVKPFNLSRSDIGELAMTLVDAATVVVGSPTVLIGAHPLAAYAAFLVNALRPKTKFVSIVGSFGWASKMVDQLAGLLNNVKVEVIAPVLFKGYPKEADLKLIEQLADQIVAKHQSQNII
jgi:flavorubredoxin